MFTDKVTLKLQAGKGGNGVVAWRREKYIPKGGPTGGNGGKGANIIIECDENVYDLNPYRHKHLIKAESGKDGGQNRRTGKSGQDLILKVPVGTLLKDQVSQEVLFDFTTHGQRQIVCQGGRGGLGNAVFARPTNRAPSYCTPGKLGTEASIELELKIIADVGLVGFPNAGKSTLVSRLTETHLKIAPYPFTTLRPSLGIIKDGIDDKGLLIADIPGIIEGASMNKGLGFEFLRHIQRTKVLLFVIDMSGIDARDPFEDLLVLRKELSHYQEDLLEKPAAIILNKMDTEEANENLKDFLDRLATQKLDLPIYQISAMEKQGFEPLKQFLQKQKPLIAT